MTRLARILSVAAMVLVADVVTAQLPDSTRPMRGLRGGRAGAVPGGRGRVGQPPRAQLETQIRQRMATVVRRELKLDDRQMRELKRTDDKFEPRRRDLTRDERNMRQTLRLALQDSISGDPAKIEQAMTRMLQIQRERIDLVEAEHKELASFMTPRQRAQYFALREQMMRRLQELGRGGPPPPG
jgi:hypothetical protein